MLAVNSSALSPIWNNRLTEIVQFYQCLNPELIEKSQQLFDLTVNSQHLLTAADPLTRDELVLDILMHSEDQGLSDDQESLDKAEKRLRSRLPQRGPLPTFEELKCAGELMSRRIQNSRECYLVDCLYSSTINLEGLVFLKVHIDDGEQFVKKQGFFASRDWIYNNQLAAKLLFDRIVARRTKDIGFKLAEDNPFSRDTDLSRANHDYWNQHVWGKEGSPPMRKIKGFHEAGYPLFFPEISPEFEAWDKKVLPETFKTLQEDFKKDLALREQNPKAPLVHLTHSTFLERKYFRKMVGVNLKVGSLTVGISLFFALFGHAAAASRRNARL